LGVERIRLITNNPDKVAQLTAAGIEVAEIRRTGVYVTDANRAYLQAKFEHRHMLDPIAILRGPGPAEGAVEVEV
jgi:GTP cyclohydrolase II